MFFDLLLLPCGAYFLEIKKQVPLRNMIMLIIVRILCCLWERKNSENKEEYGCESELLTTRGQEV